MASLLAVADAGSITEAAAELHVSQSALSRRLQQLEADLGAELLVRSRHGVELTELGRQTVEEGQRIVARYDAVRQNIVAQQNLERGLVRVGGGATVTSFLLPATIAAFQADHPGIRFYVKEAGSREIATLVRGGELDLGLVTLPLPAGDLRLEPISRDEIVLVATDQHPLATGRALTIDQLDGQPFVAFEQGSAIRHLIDRALAAAGVQLDVVMELRSIPTILKMVATTGSLAFVSRVSVPSEPRLRILPVRGLSLTRQLGLAARSDVPLSPAAAAFAAVLRATFSP